MKLKVWIDENGKRHTSLDDVEIGNILVGLTMENRPRKPSYVTLEIVPSDIEIEAEAEVTLSVDGNKYRLKAIN